ncbi:MAG TPA: hypothetical protein VNK96_07820 [Fimbriimonadales bacterium]|nr:hypothetical protein [Fimbriimonadales bacterium]
MKHERRIPPELDELLWVAAESDNPETREEFARRYPDLRATLATRRAMVEALRRSKPEALKELKLSFQRPVQKRLLRTWRLIAIPAALVLLFALGFAAYFVTNNLQSPTKEQNERISQPDIGTAPQESEPKKGLEPILVPPGETSNAPKMEYEQLQPSLPSPQQPSQTKTVLVVLPKGETTLLDLLTDISNQSHKRFELLPGVQNVRIKVRPVLGDGQPIPLDEVLAMIERAAPVRIIDNGEEGYLVFPEDMVNSDG